jgi:hypothetical protein
LWVGRAACLAYPQCSSNIDNMNGTAKE